MNTRSGKLSRRFNSARLAGLLVAPLVLIFQSAQAAVTLPYLDAFTYAEGNLITVGGPTWILGNGTSSFEIAVSNSAALTAPAGFPASSGKGVRRAPSGSARRAAIQYTSLPNTVSNTMFVSFLLNVQTAPGANELIGYLDNNSTSQGSPQAGIFAGNGVVGIGKKSSGAGFTSAIGAGTHLVIVRYTFLAANDKVDLWVDPASADYGAATAPASLGNVTGGSDPVSLDYFQISTSSGAGSVMFLDEVRFGTNWSDVVPSGGPVVGQQLGFTTQPTNAAPNSTMNPVVVQVQTAGGAAVASNNVPITLTLTGGSGTLSGTLTQNTDASGKATFSNLTIDTAGTGKQLTATASGIGAGLTNAVSTTFSIIAPSIAAKLAFTTQPATALVNATMNAVVVQIQDVSSVAVASNNVPITLTLTAGSGALGGTTTVNSDATGKATFSTLTVDTAGTGKQLTAAASGIGTGLTNAVSGNFSITNAPVISVTGGPVITQAVVNVAGVILRGTNGTPSGSYQVLNSTNLALPAAQWRSLATNLFSGLGNFDCTNPPPAFAQNFYRLLAAANAPSSNNIIGYAYGTTGAGNTTNIITVTNTAGLSNALVRLAGPLVIQVAGVIPLRTDANTPVNFGSKTIVGVGTNSGIMGDLIVENPENSNVIIRNLRLSNPNATAGDRDAVTISRGATNVWVDHCDIFDAVDGGLDVVNGADFVTVSWCRFYYDVITTHKNVNLIGNSDTSSLDAGKLHVTFHHNWWDVQCTERMPSVRFGRVHVFNSYFNSPGNSYCIRTRLYAEVLAENNYFDHANDAFEQYININTGTEPADAHGLLKAAGNILDGCTTNYTYILTQPLNPGTLVSSNATSITFDQDGKTFTIVNVAPGGDTLTPAGTDPIGLNPPPYPYTLDAASAVPNLVTNNAGCGRGPFAP